jgi:plastocyanin
MSIRRTHLTIALVAAVLGAAACGSDGSGDGGTNSPPPNDNTVQALPSLAFSPASLTVNAGETVTFEFGGVQHNVFFDAVPGAPANIEQPTSNASVDRVFAMAGTYPYQCHIHPQMHGTIVVQ